MPPIPEPGTTETDERTFTEADVAAFAAVSGDRQDRHTDPDETVLRGEIEAVIRE